MNNGNDQGPGGIALLVIAIVTIVIVAWEFVRQLSASAAS